MVIGQATFTDQASGTSDRLLGASGGVAYAGDTLFIADSSRFNGVTPQNRRVVLYRNVSTKFPGPEDAIPSDISRCPVCTGRNDFPHTFDVVLGQPNFTTSDPGLAQNLLRLPTAVASNGTILAVADTENNRILIWNSIPGVNGAPADIVLGQEGFTAIQQANVVTASSMRGPQGVWIRDNRLYVADTQNHRVLIWRTIPTKNNQPADIVLGQANFTTAPQPDLTKLTTAAKANNMLNPVSVMSDGQRLIVTDLGFQRVLIWNTIPDTTQAPADVVVGEPDMESTTEGGNDATKLCQPTGNKDANGNDIYPTRCAGTLSFPRYALSDGQRLFIADGGNDRVLVFNSFPTANGASADAALGQVDMTGDIITDYEDLFTPNLQRSSSDTIRTPTSLAWDGTNLYVADPFDRRVLVFTPEQPNVPRNGVRNAASLSVYAVGSIIFTAAPTENDQVTLTIGTTNYVYKAVKDDKIANVVNGLAAAINAGNGDPNILAIPNPDFNSITLTSRVAGPDGNNITVTYTLSTSATLALTLTPPRGGQNAANIAPGTLVTLQGTNLADSTAAAPANAETLPRDLAGVQVYFDGIRAPLLYVSPTQINAQMPYEVLDTTSVTSWVRTKHANGTVTVTDPVGVPIPQQAPGIFADFGEDPRPAIAFHASGSATTTLLIDGSIKAGDVGTLSIGNPARTYTYTVQTADTLTTIRDYFIGQINSNPDEQVTATAGGSFTRIILSAKEPGDAGIGIPVTSTVTGTNLTLSVSNPTLCCAGGGGQITPGNPAVPGELIYIYATGLGLVGPEEAKQGLRTGGTYQGPAVNDPVSFVAALAGGFTASVITAAAEPGTIGLYKVLLELNSSLPTNPATQVTIAQDIYVSNIVTIPVVNPTPPAQ